MKLDMDTYLKICEITGQDYEAAKSSDEDYVLMYHDLDNVIYDLITQYGVIEEKHNDMKEKTKEKLDWVEDAMFQLDMIDRWTDGDKLAWELRNQEKKHLEEILNEKEQ